MLRSRSLVRCCSAFVLWAAATHPAVAAQGKAAPKARAAFTHPARFGSNRIVEGVSIGGVKVGMSKSAAIAVWGTPDGPCRRGSPYDPDDRRRVCEYGGFLTTRGTTQSGRPYAWFTATPAGRVVSVGIDLEKPTVRDADLKAAYENAALRVRPLRTSKGIRLRSTMEAARRAYGIPTPTNVPDNAVKDLLGTTIVRQGSGCTVFGWSGSAPTFKFVDSISVTDATWCPKDPDPNAE